MSNKKLGVVGIFLFLIIGFIFIINSSAIKNVSADCDPACASSEICSNSQCHLAICEIASSPPNANFTKVMGLSSSTNAHGELVSESNYNYGLYCNFPGEFSYGGILMYLSSQTNAHAGNPSWTSSDNYDVPVYYSGFEYCRGSSSGSPGLNEIEVPVPLYSNYSNSHINGGSLNIYCKPNITNIPYGGNCNNNGICDTGEECDGNNFCGETCETQGYSGGGNLICNNCVIDTSECIGEEPPTAENAYWARYDDEIKITEMVFGNGEKVKLIINNSENKGSPISLEISETQGYKPGEDPLIINAEWSSNKYVGIWEMYDSNISKFNKYPDGPFDLTFTSENKFPGLTSSHLNLSISNPVDEFCIDYPESNCNDAPQDVADRTVNPILQNLNPPQHCGVNGYNCYCYWKDSNSSCEGGYNPPYDFCDESNECWFTGSGSLCLDNCTCSNGLPDGQGYCENGVACNTSNECWLAGDLCDGETCNCTGETVPSNITLGTCSSSPDDDGPGNCLSLQFGNDTCEDDNHLTSNYTATFNWTQGNNFSTFEECNTTFGGKLGCIYYNKDQFWHYDPLNASGDCKDGSYTVLCPAQIQLGFFDSWNFFVVIILIFVIYYLWSSNNRKKKSFNKKKSSKRVKKKK